MNPARKRLINGLFKNHIKVYASPDTRLIEQFSDSFSGSTGGGDLIR